MPKPLPDIALVEADSRVWGQFDSTGIDSIISSMVDLCVFLSEAQWTAIDIFRARGYLYFNSTIPVKNGFPRNIFDNYCTIDGALYQFYDADVDDDGDLIGIGVPKGITAANSIAALSGMISFSPVTVVAVEWDESGGGRLVLDAKVPGALGNNISIVGNGSQTVGANTAGGGHAFRSMFADVAFEDQTGFSTSSVVDVEGVDVTRISGDPFDLGWPGKIADIGGTLSVVVSVSDTDHLIITDDLGTLTASDLSVTNPPFAGVNYQEVKFIYNSPDTQEALFTHTIGGYTGIEHHLGKYIWEVFIDPFQIVMTPIDDAAAAFHAGDIFVSSNTSISACLNVPEDRNGPFVTAIQIFGYDNFRKQFATQNAYIYTSEGIYTPHTDSFSEFGYAILMWLLSEGQVKSWNSDPYERLEAFVCGRINAFPYKIIGRFWNAYFTTEVVTRGTVAIQPNDERAIALISQTGVGTLWWFIENPPEP